MCVCMWTFLKIKLEENNDPQTSQENGFFPVQMWPYKDTNPQTIQEYGLTTLTKCVFACVFLNWYAVKMLTYNFYKKMPSVGVSILIFNYE